MERLGDYNYLVLIEHFLLLPIYLVSLINTGQVLVVNMFGIGWSRSGHCTRRVKPFASDYEYINEHFFFFPFGSFYTYFHYFTILEYRPSVDSDVQRLRYID